MSSVRLVLLPYLQRWETDPTKSTLKLRVLLIPRGNPLDPLVTGGPSFATARLKLAIYFASSDDLPSPGGGPAAYTVIDSPAPPNALDIFRALATQFDIDPVSKPAKRPPVGTTVRKHLPQSYRTAANYAPGRTDLVATDSTYSCALKGGKFPPKYKRLPERSSRIPWGKVISFVLRNPKVAEAVGLIRPLEISINPSDALKNGGFGYVTLDGSSDAAGLTTTGGLKIYATRIPNLEPLQPRSLFTPVLLPVVDPPPALDYAEIFAEIVDYDDGWAKAVHCGQQQGLDAIIGIDSPDKGRPIQESGLKLGWDDEQVTIWTNRQLDPSQAQYDAQTGISGYRVDVRLAGTAKWTSLVHASGDIRIGNITLQPFDGDLAIEVHPTKHDADFDTPGPYWLPMYFTSWTGPPLVLEDLVRKRLREETPDPREIKGVQPDVQLAYGKTYEFQVRLVDGTGGGPGPDEAHLTPGPSPIASIQYKRCVPPLTPILLNPREELPPVPSPESPPARLRFKRPLLQYPAVVCTGKYTDPIGKLVADIPQAKIEEREPGLRDPDVQLLKIVVEVQTFSQDPAATDDTFVPIFTSTRPFPPDFETEAAIDIQWRDAEQILEFAGEEEGKTSGPLILPTARNVRVRFSSMCVESPGSHYFGASDVLVSSSIYVTLRKNPSSEIDLFASDEPSDIISSYYLQPDPPTEPKAQVAAFKSGKVGEEPTDICSRISSALGIRVSGLTLRGPVGRRVLFGCSAGLRHTLGPDKASLTFASKSDLSHCWITVIRLTVNRDWSWNGLKQEAITVSRDGHTVGSIVFPNSLSLPDALAGDQTEARTGTDIIYFDSVNPLPQPPEAFPQILNLSYQVTPSFQGSPTADPPRQYSIRLPITTPPKQTPKIVSAGLAFSEYNRSADYSTSYPRQRGLWLEFESSLEDTRDGYFARVIRNVPDPLLLSSALDIPDEKPSALPIDPEPIRRIVPGQAADKAGLSAMTRLIPADGSSPRHYLLPLPVDPDSASLFGFWSYEFRVGHDTVWSTAQGRFGPGLLVNGIQHPPPELKVSVTRAPGVIRVMAAHAVPVYDRTVLLFMRPPRPTTTMWVMLYAQVTQADGQDARNVLLEKRVAIVRQDPQSPDTRRFVDAWGETVFKEDEVKGLLDTFGIGRKAGLSVMVVELMPIGKVNDPLGAGLGRQRILRTSVLTPIVSKC